MSGSNPVDERMLWLIAQSCYGSAEAGVGSALGQRYMHIVDCRPQSSAIGECVQ